MHRTCINQIFHRVVAKAGQLNPPRFADGLVNQPRVTTSSKFPIRRLVRTTFNKEKDHVKATVPRSRGISQLNLTDGLISWRNRPRGSLLACDLPEGKSSCHGAKRDTTYTTVHTSYYRMQISGYLARFNLSRTPSFTLFLYFRRCRNQ